ncbi:MAG: hypothetical protein HYX24_03725 [Candidatus Aenigmarchaeota archaeon]|nr:hypothetical protein [Candidatus Aenigmarchaeota archaeon]
MGKTSLIEHRIEKLEKKSEEEEKYRRLHQVALILNAFAIIAAIYVVFLQVDLEVKSQIDLSQPTAELVLYRPTSFFASELTRLPQGAWPINMCLRNNGKIEARYINLILDQDENPWLRHSSGRIETISPGGDVNCTPSNSQIRLTSSTCNYKDKDFICNESQIPIGIQHLIMGKVTL